uniref:Uncharacterized protein n=1 Tax=Meloidogyne enterolobii TaxID=390850 RepID=A0A6V7U6Y9_MELEN|nr:unnamed protein product [Meloidogyne enterolobii]
MKLSVTKDITKENRTKYFAKESRKWFFDIKTFAKLSIASKTIGFLYYIKECLEDLIKLNKNKKNKKQNKILTNEEKTDLALECFNKKIPLKLSGKEKLNEIHVNKLKEIFNDKNNNAPEIKFLFEKIKKAEGKRINK